MCATWRSCVTCGTCPLCIIFYKFGHRMPVPADSPDAIGRRLPVPGRFVEYRRTSVHRRTSDAGSSRFAGCHRTSGAGSGRFAGCHPPAATGTDHCRMPDRRLPPVPITVGCRAAGHHRYRSPSDAGPPVRFVGAAGPMPDALCHQSNFGLSKTFTCG